MANFAIRLLSSVFIDTTSAADFSHVNLGPAHMCFASAHTSTPDPGQFYDTMKIMLSNALFNGSLGFIDTRRTCNVTSGRHQLAPRGVVACRTTCLRNSINCYDFAMTLMFI